MKNSSKTPYEWRDRAISMRAVGWDAKGKMQIALVTGRSDQGGEAPTLFADCRLLIFAKSLEIPAAIPIIKR